MDESITIILLSLAELCLVACGLAIFFYFRSKKYKIESLKGSAPKPTQTPSDKSAVHAYLHEQVQKLQLLLKDGLVDTKSAVDARLKLLQNESMLLSKDNIDYGQQLNFYQKILASVATITAESTPQLNPKTESITSEDTLFELDELEMPTTPDSEETAEISIADIPVENTDDDIEINHSLTDDSLEALQKKDMDVVAVEQAVDAGINDEFELADEQPFDIAAADEFELADEAEFETVAEDEFAFDAEDEFETAAEDEFAFDAENEFEATAEDEFAFDTEDEFETAAEDEFAFDAEDEFETATEDEFAFTAEDDSEFVTEHENEEFIEKESKEPAEDGEYNEDIPILQDTIELDGPLITGELKNESAEIGKIRNIVSSLHGTIEELKQFADEHELDADADEYLTTKLEEIEISNARLNMCTETLERDNARLLELVNQKEEEPQEISNTDSEINSVEIIPEKDRKEKIELLEVELSSLEKRLDDKTNRLDNLQTQETDLTEVAADDNTQTFNQLMREIDNLTELLTVKSEELSKLRVHAINPEDEVELQKETGT